MSSSFTKRLRLNKQGTGDNEDSWGVELNVGGLDRSDDAWGTVEVVVNGSYTLTIQQGLADEARGLVLRLTGTGGTLNVPAVDKPYMIENGCSAAVTVTPQGGTGVVVRAGSKVWYYANAAGDTGFIMDPRLDQIATAGANVALGGYKLTGVGTATASGDATTFANRLDQFAAPNVSVSFNGQKITNLADPTSDQDAATKAWVDTSTAASAAAAAASASAAATSASNAATSATNAATSEANTAAIYDTFDDRWLGPKASDPTVDNDGTPLLTGAAYFNTAANQLRIYTGSAWLPISTVTLSSQAQAETGTDNTTVMTPLRVSQNIAAKVGVSVQAYDADLQAIAALGHTSGYVIVDNGTSWTAGLYNSPKLIVRDEKPSGTSGGTPSATTWNVRTLNTVDTNTISGASLASNQITLPAGTYEVDISGPAYGQVGVHKLRLFNVSDSTATLIGTSETNLDNNLVTTNRSFLRGTLTIAATKIFRVEHYTGASFSNGFGAPSSVSGTVEVYTIAQFKKVA